MITPIQIDERILLKAPDPIYADDLMHILANQPMHLRQWLPSARQNDSPQELKRFLKNLAAFNQGGQRFITFIFYDKKLAGSIGLVRIDRHHRRGEIGYWLRKELQGRGIITRCCRWLLSHAFEKMQLHRLEMRIPSNNQRSLAVPRRLGFHHEGTLRHYLRLNGGFQDMEVFGLLKEDVSDTTRTMRQ